MNSPSPVPLRSLLTGRINLIKTIPDFILFSLGIPTPEVFYGYENCTMTFGKFHYDDGTVWTEFDGVIGQIVQYLLDQHSISACTIKVLIQMQFNGNHLFLRRIPQKWLLYFWLLRLISKSFICKGRPLESSLSKVEGALGQLSRRSVSSIRFSDNDHHLRWNRSVHDRFHKTLWLEVKRERNVWETLALRICADDILRFAQFSDI